MYCQSLLFDITLFISKYQLSYLPGILGLTKIKGITCLHYLYSALGLLIFCVVLILTYLKLYNISGTINYILQIIKCRYFILLKLKIEKWMCNCLRKVNYIAY